MTDQIPPYCQWTDLQISESIAKILPACPYKHTQQILKIIAHRHWLGIKLSAVVEQVAGNYIRHVLTDYDALIDRHGLEPDEARVAVDAEVGDVLRDWKRDL